MLKRIFILFLFLTHVAFAGGNIFESKYLNLGLSLKFQGSHEANIAKLTFGKDRFFSLSVNGKLKIWNLETGELIKSVKLKGENFKTIAVGDKNIYVLSANKIYFLNLEGDVLKESKGNFRYLFYKKPYLYILYSNGKLAKVEPDSGDIIYEKSIAAYYEGVGIYDRYIIVGDSRAKTVYLLSNGEKLNTIKTESTNLFGYPAKDKIGCIWRNGDTFYVYDIKTGQLDLKYNTGYKTETFGSIGDYKVIFVIEKGWDHFFVLADVKDKNFKKRIFKIPEEVEYFEISPDRSYIAAVVDNGKIFRVYKTPFGRIKTEENKVIDNKKESSNDNKSLPKESLSQDNEKDGLEKEREEVLDIKKPMLELHPSTTEGFAPLDVKIAILASDDTGIVAYFISIDGKAKMKKGTPPSTISITFYEPGVHKVVVAVKDKAGNIEKKEVIFKVKEKTFEDYKKEYLGN